MSSISWADLEDSEEDKLVINDDLRKQFNMFGNSEKNNQDIPVKYSEKVKEYSEVIEHDRDPEKKSENSWVKVVGKKSKKKKREKCCYTCNPRKHVKKYIILKNDIIQFQFDMCNRPIIMATPILHFSYLRDQDPEYIGNIISEVEKFCLSLDLKKYQIQYNFNLNETKASSNHFHIKIKLDEEIIAPLKKKHFNALNT